MPFRKRPIKGKARRLKVVYPLTNMILRQQKKDVKPIPTIVGRDWAIVNGEFFEFTEEERKWRNRHGR